MTVTRVQFFDEPHVMQPGSVAEYLRDFGGHRPPATVESGISRAQPLPFDVANRKGRGPCC